MHHSHHCSLTQKQTCPNSSAIRGLQGHLQQTTPIEELEFDMYYIIFLKRYKSLLKAFNTVYKQCMTILYDIILKVMLMLMKLTAGVMNNFIEKL